MTRAPARPDRSSSLLRRTAAAATLAAALVTGVAEAAPLALQTEADSAAFAARLHDYAGASRLRWIVAAPTEKDAQAAIARIAAELNPADRALAGRMSPRSFEDASLPAEGPPVRVFAEPQFSGAAGAKTCSWQVWLTDPSLPSAGADPVTVPLAPSDRLPAGAGATFRVGHTGLLQNRLYAFDETRPGAIRDLATAPDVNVPVAAGDSGETIFLATARETAPFLESVRAALGGSGGQRRDLGQTYALRPKLLGESRGIGANIQLLSQDMIVAKTSDVAAANAPADAAKASLMETCVYALTPAK